MTIEQAIAILNPDHVERYDKIEAIDKACKMGIEALKKQIPKKPDRDKDQVLFRMLYGKCPECGSAVYSGLAVNTFCSECGQAINWKQGDENDG